MTRPDLAYGTACLALMAAAVAALWWPRERVTVWVEAEPEFECRYVERWGEMVEGTFRTIEACHEFEPRKGQRRKR
jgi:hypothetical protein